MFSPAERIDLLMQGAIAKMRTRLESPVRYQLPIGDACVDMNSLLGKAIELVFTGAILCVTCGRKTKKSFNQGHCFPCLKCLASCDQCIVRPELCHYHAGTCREPEWGESHCLQPHVVYLANSSGLKVGVTRASQVPTRWIDQGASQAVPVFEVGERRTAGLLEVTLRQVVADRTDWRRMLKGSPDALNMLDERTRILNEADAFIAGLKQSPDWGDTRSSVSTSVCEITYPVITYPEKVKAHNFDKTARVSGELLGIKGQYLIFDTGVLNIRKFAGYELALATG
ncbi:MAG: DUF2797 domain-containing protein [Arenicellales bacterium]|nr:DUF2797 domain-containing protein [Arenicellales bacterium]MDP6790477.1 DUF2797 domain-containing protein [Arenicellales bacterium]MDP6917716.1 DUF2797 domain-containing protein [Arenicellales bacterium]